MNLFIDTNVFLSFYHFSSDDLEELKKLVVLLKQKKVRLFRPQQLVDEFQRNRDSKIADAMRRLREGKFAIQFPQFCKDYPEYEKLRNLLNAAGKLHADFVEKLTQEIEDQALRADATIKSLFDLATAVPTSTELLARVQKRALLGNPPGKKDSLGDAINWETLLEAVPTGEDLFFISDDRDYSSPLDEGAFNSFLLSEWAARKKSGLVFFQALSHFFKKHFPDITLASELEKDLLISDLASSYSFAQTHIVIGKLSNYSDFTAAQLNAIATAATTNSQVRSIITDSDVKELLESAIKGKERLIEPETLAELKKLLGGEEEPPDEEVPF